MTGKKSNLFYILCILTIAIIRLFVLIFPERHIIIDGIIIHHFWFGVAALLISFLISARYKILIFSVGFGLIIDQLIFMLLGGGLNKEYWALPSAIGMILLLIMTYFIRNKIFKQKV